METTSSHLTLNVSDWDHTRSVQMDVPWDASVSEVVEEARRGLQLPSDVSYSALFRNRQLGGMETLRDAGIDADSDFEIMPEVEAGARVCSRGL